VQMSNLLLNDYIDGGFVAANEWRRVRIPIADLVDSDYVLTRINIGWPLIGQAALYYLDSLHFVPYDNAPVLTASVDLNSQLADVDPSLYGSNGAYWSNNMHLNNLPEFVKQAGVTSTRYPGGNLSDSFHFRDWLLSSVSEWITQPDEFISYLQQSNTNAVITTNFGTGTAVEAADFVDYMVVENSVATDLWEVGNEIYGGWTTSWTHDGELYMTGDATHDGANDFCTAMKLVDPTIDVAMVGTIADHEYNSFGPEALQEASTCFDAYSFHYYPLGPSQHNYFNLITSPHADFPLVTDNINAMIQSHAPGLSLKLAMTEYNSYWTNPNDLAYEVVNLLFLADTMGLAATHGVDMAHHWFIGGAPNNSPYYFVNNYPNYEREPSYFVFPLMSSLTGQLHSVTNNLHGSEVSLFASTDNGETHIIAVNKTDKSVSAVIDLQGYTGSAVSAAVTEVVGTGLNANSVSYNGNSNPPLNLSTVPDGSVAISAGQISYSLQPYSLTRFTIAH